ncbi:hypothetical protein EYF80_059897 [Liparis tanakae]|uniref:Uncharacterized protein n=1 Tax=Liparis tanakae TaxID=230148 RepID=A0A4Z2ENI5_9TELE|nr:hypothetical protein EYF80_059897 [Liparis tanakae]
MSKTGPSVRRPWRNKLSIKAGDQQEETGAAGQTAAAPVSTAWSSADPEPSEGGPLPGGRRGPRSL